MNAQFYEEETKSIAVINLVCREVKEKHTGENIRDWVLEAMSQFGITGQQLVALSIDSASNITKAMKDLIITLNSTAYNLLTCDEDAVVDQGEIDAALAALEDIEPNQSSAEYQIHPQSCVYVHCAAHRLQLPVCKFLFKDDQISVIVARVSKLAAKLRTPIVRRLVESETEDENLKQPIMSQVTRWSSTFRMIERALTYKNFCKRHETVKELKELKVENEQWYEFRDLVAVLEPTQVLTTKLQAQNLTVSDCLFYWLEMKEELEGLSNSGQGKVALFSNKLIACLREKEEAVFNNKIALAGCYLGQKLQFTMTAGQIDGAKSMIRMVVMKKLEIAKLSEPAVDEQDMDEVRETIEETENAVENLSSLDRKIREAMTKAKESSSQLSQTSSSQSGSSYERERAKVLAELEKEFAAYEEDVLSSPSMPTKPSLGYWQTKCDSMPILSSAALDINCVPMTEVSVERLFSHLNFIFTERRNRTKGDIIEDILFLRLNKKYQETSD